MSQEEIIEKLKNIFNLVVHNGVNTDHISLDSHIVKDLGVNSVGLIYMAIAIEKEFGINMTEFTADSFETIGDVVKFIESRI